MTNTASQEEALQYQLPGAEGTLLGSRKGEESLLLFSEENPWDWKFFLLSFVLLACSELMPDQTVAHTPVQDVHGESHRGPTIRATTARKCLLLYFIRQEQRKQCILPFIALKNIIIDYTEPYMSCLERKHLDFPLWVKHLLWRF